MDGYHLSAISFFSLSAISFFSLSAISYQLSAISFFSLSAISFSVPCSLFPIPYSLFPATTPFTLSLPHTINASKINKANGKMRKLNREAINPTNGGATVSPT